MGALYIFRTEEDLQEYLRSDRWQKKIPEKYGYKPEVVAVLDVGAILYKEAVMVGRAPGSRSRRPGAEKMTSSKADGDLGRVHWI